MDVAFGTVVFEKVFSYLDFNAQESNNRYDTSIIHFLNIPTMLHSALSEIIIQSFFKVYNTLGYGFLEKVYENAMIVELKRSGLFAEQQKKIWVYYEGEVVGDYYADIIVDNKIILELKASKEIGKDHENQLINYLKATDKEVGLLLNFGKKPELRRKVFSNNHKEWWTSGDKWFRKR